jgi:rhodanese-related sulfurtransferase
MRYILLSILLAFGLFSCSNGQDKSTAAAGERIVVTADEFAKRPDGAQLVDVRTPGEWRAGVIDGAMLCDIYSADFDERISGLDPSKPVYVYCAVGGRSGNAAEKLKAMGFKVYDLKGGMGAWKAQGKPTAPCLTC